MQIEITPKIAAYIEMTMAAGSALSPVGAIESLIDAAVDAETGLSIADLQSKIDEGLASGTLEGDAAKGIADVFRAAGNRHGF
ncbi:MAG: hypothetical protein C0519_09680 [Hyphomicrobium sp.]|nr:hypothetical protein [Hyphomicrobium sp.]